MAAVLHFPACLPWMGAACVVTVKLGQELGSGDGRRDAGDEKQ